MRNGAGMSGEGIVMDITQPPFSPQAPQNPPESPAIAIRDYLKLRGIWQTIEGRFALNDEVSRQVRRDTLRFRIGEKHRLGI